MATNNINRTEARRNPLADTEIPYTLDPVAMTVLARQWRTRELLRMLRALVSRTVDGVIAWQRRTALERRLSEMPDYRLADIGIRRDQIAAAAGGRVHRQATALEMAVQSPRLGFLDAGKTPAGDDEAASAPPLAA